MAVISAFGSGLWLDSFASNGDLVALFFFVLTAAISGFCYNRGNT
jgi:hypothetical protein